MTGNPLPMVHSPLCLIPDAHAVCACGANVVCRSCGWGRGQAPCKCSPKLGHHDLRMSHATVSPARTRYWDPDAVTWALRRIGWYARYPDNTIGPIRKTRAEARADAKAWTK